MIVDIRDFIRKVEDWIPGRGYSKQGGFVNEDLNPVLLVPGIGGSILNAVSEDGSVERVWVRLFGADAEFREKLYSAFDPNTGKTVSLNDKIKIEVPDDRHGIYSCDILDPDVLIRMNVVYYFHDLIEKMLSWGYEQVFGFGYDFRQSNRLSEVMDTFKNKLETLYNRSGGKKVNVVSHSMGGLLVKCFLALHCEAFEKYVGTWIAITAPWQGAPGFVTDCLLTGVEFVKGWQKELFIAKWSTHQLLMECPSIYELMPPHDFKWTKPPELQLWRRKNANDLGVEKVTHGPQSCVDVMRAALEDNLLFFKGEAFPCPFNNAILEWANKTREIMKTAKLPKGVLFYNIYGTSQQTPFDVCYGSPECPIEKLSDILATEAKFTCVDGDGTVPAESAKADGLDAVARVGIPGDHRGILLDERLFRVVKHWLKAGDLDPFYDPLNDFVILPTTAEYEAYMKKKIHVKIQSQEADEYIAAALISGSNGRIDARAEAHAKLDLHRDEDDDDDDDDDDYVQISTYGVAEGSHRQARCQLLEEAMAAASGQAIAAAHTKLVNVC